MFGDIPRRLKRNYLKIMLPDQSAISCFTITNSQQDDYFWQPNFSDHMILNQKRQSTSDDLSEKKLL